MQSTYNPAAPKKPANLSINADLLARARELDINLSATLEQALIEALKARQREQWLAENQSAIQTYNDRVEKHGVFSDGSRTF